MFFWLSVLLICRNIVHYPVFLWLYGCFSLCSRLYVCAYWCIGVYSPMVVLLNDIVFPILVFVGFVVFVLFLFLTRFFIKNRNSVISVNSFKMCPTWYYRRDFCTKITGTRRLCLSIPCTCFQIVFINHCNGFYWGAIKKPYYNYIVFVF